MLKQKRALIMAILSSFILVSVLYGCHIYFIWIKQYSFSFTKYYLLLANIVPVAFGMILATLQLLAKHKKKFSVNWINLIIQGIPAFLIAFPSFYFIIEKPMVFEFAGHISVSVMAGVWLGYIIISSLFKEESDK